jgi:MFS transporter, putative metabolite transport protein
MAGMSVQDYIDEQPTWPDGTPLPATPMTRMQWRIWSLAAAGKFFEGFVVFMTGVALPLIATDFHIAASQKGVISAASLFGILIGAVALGGLSDYFGRKRMFVFEMILFCIFLVLLTLVQNYLSLVICLFGLGLALGCDYPTAHMIISENIPSAVRGRLVLGAFAFQAIGALAGTGVGFFVLSQYPQIDAWRWMYAIAIIPAVLVTAGRFFITESAHWLLSRGHVSHAEDAVLRLLHRAPKYPQNIALAEHATAAHKETHAVSPLALFSPRNIRATIFASVPWFIQDLGTYGIGIFTPTILAAAFGKSSDHVRSTADLIRDDILAAKGSALITALLIVGIAFAVVLADKVGRIKLQVFGFVGCAAGLLIASFSVDASPSMKIPLIFIGFMLFDFMTNLGPNAQTYLLAGEVFPTEVRGMGAGFAAAFAKVGAVLTAFLFPILLAGIGTRALLYALVVTSLLGAVVTWMYRIETTGVKLDRIGAAVTAAALILVLLIPGRAVAADTVVLNETGSTLFFPLFRTWAAEYRHEHPNIRVTVAGTGSGAGIAQAISGAVEIGASDAYMSDDQVRANPQIINIPLAISAQTINYNLPGVNTDHLKLSGPVIAAIYSGKLTSWDAKPIADLNPGVRLPHQAIVTIHRSDGSGDTFMFTQFLSFSTDAWSDGPNYGSTIAWPSAPGAIGAAGNPGVVSALAAHPFSIGYVGVSYAGDIARNRLGTAMLENQSGKFLLPTPSTVRAGADALDPRTPPDERLTLVFAPGDNSYPIVSYEYAVVSTKQRDPQTADELKNFLLWALDTCNGSTRQNLDAANFIALPVYVRALSIVQIEKIH